MRVDHALTEVILSEEALASRLERLAARPGADLEVVAAAHTEARKARARSRHLDAVARAHGAPTATTVRHLQSGIVDAVRRPPHEITDRSAPVAVQLIDDLLEAQAEAARAQAAWVALQHAAKALADAHLASRARSCHAQCEGASSWLLARLTVAAP